MPVSGPKSFCSLEEVRRTETEIVYAEPRGHYVGAGIVALIVGAVIGPTAWELASWIAGRLEGTAGLVLAALVVVAAAAGMFWFWLQFGLHVRHELRLDLRGKAATMVRHRLLGRSRETAFTAGEIREVELVHSEVRGRDFYELALIDARGEPVYLDGCTQKGEMAFLAKDIAGALGVPLVEKRA